MSTIAHPYAGYDETGLNNSDNLRRQDKSSRSELLAYHGENDHSIIPPKGAHQAYPDVDACEHEKECYYGKH